MRHARHTLLLFFACQIATEFLVRLAQRHMFFLVPYTPFDDELPIIFLHDESDEALKQFCTAAFLLLVSTMWMSFKHVDTSQIYDIEHRLLF